MSVLEQYRTLAYVAYLAASVLFILYTVTAPPV